jgi:hypothetical protein
MARIQSLDEINALKTRSMHSRARILAELNAIFRSGEAPSPALNGVYAGDLIAVDIAPGLTQLGEWFLGRGIPWKGKVFDAASSTGINLFARGSLFLARLLWPLYRGTTHIGPETYRAFAFRTYLAPGLADPDRQVLKIDYNLNENPALSVRRVLDELVQIGEGAYLGKAHLKWWWGKWQMIAYFSLKAG